MFTVVGKTKFKLLSQGPLAKWAYIFTFKIILPQSIT